MEVITSTTPAMTAANQLNQQLAESEAQPVLLMLSGGSALAILEHVDVALFGSHVTITTLDERFSTDPGVNNFAQIAVTEFYAKAIASGAHTISTRVGPDESLPVVAERFAAALHSWRTQHPSGVIMVTMGVGSDGHTAGIFPGDYGIDFEADDWVVAYSVPTSVHRYPERITVTNTFLREQVAHTIGYITGEEKRAVLNHLRAATCDRDLQPACIMREMSQVTLFTSIRVGAGDQE